jgi:hypothetical protein
VFERSITILQESYIQHRSIYFLIYKPEEWCSRFKLKFIFISFEISAEKLFVILRHYATLRALLWKSLEI